MIMNIDEAIAALTKARAKVGGDAPLLMVDGLHVEQFPIGDGCVYVSDPLEPKVDPVSMTTKQESRTNGCVTSSREAPGYVVAFHERVVDFLIKAGESLVRVRLTLREMENILIRLDPDSPFPPKDDGGLMAWWDHEADSPLELYQDGRFSIMLPHQCGLDLVAAIRTWLPEFAHDRGVGVMEPW
jgi:hypothetical protein